MTNPASAHDGGVVLTADMARLKLEDYSAIAFDDIETITPEAAHIIVAFTGGLVFERVSHLPDQIALILSQHDALDFPSLRSFDGLSDATLAALGSRPTAYRAFNGVSHITARQLQLLAAGGCFLELGGLTELTDDLLAIFASFSGSLRLNGLQTLSALQTRQLLGNFPIPRKHIDLNGISALDEDTASVVGASGSTNVSLNGLTTISPRVAAHLARVTGSLSLGGLSELTDEVAEALSHHTGPTLALDGMPTLTASVARSLARHTGQLHLFTDTSGHQPRSLGADVYRALLPHRGAVTIECITAPALASLAETIARRSVHTDRVDVISDDDVIGLGEEGAFSAGPGWGGDLISLTTSAGDEIAVAPDFLALAQHLQCATVTSVTLRNLLSWFGAQRRGKNVVDRIRATITAFQKEGFASLPFIQSVLDADDLDLVHVFPPTASLTSSLAEALRAPMTRLGYHIVDGDNDVVRFQSVFATGRRRVISIRRVEADPCIIRAEVSIVLPDDAATLALAIVTAHRLNRRSFVGRYRIDPANRTFHFDISGAVRILSDLREADEPTGILPRLLHFAEAADLLMHRLLLQEPVHDLPDRSLEGVDLVDADLELLGAVVEGSSLRVASSIVLGPRPFNPDEGDEEPPRVAAETVGHVSRMNCCAEHAKVFLARDTTEVESVLCELAIIVTDSAVLEDLASWMNEQVNILKHSIRDELLETGVMPRIDTVDEILAALNRTPVIDDDEELEESAEDLDEEGDTPEEAEVLRLLCQNDAAAVRQGLALAVDLGSVDIWRHLLVTGENDADGQTAVDVDGRIDLGFDESWGTSSGYISKFVFPKFREEVALFALRHSGALDDVRALTLSDASSSQLSALRGLTQLRSLHLSGDEALDLGLLLSVPALESLALNGLERIPDMSALRGHPRLRTLHLNNIALSAEDLRSLGLFESLSISATALSSDHLAALSALPALRDLRLSFLDDLRDLGALASASSLEVLHLGYCDELTDVSAVRQLSLLRDFQVQCCRHISDIAGLDIRVNQQVRLPGFQTFLHDMSQGGPLYQLFFDESLIRRAFNPRVFNISPIADAVDRLGDPHWREHPCRILLLHSADSRAIAALLETLPEIDCRDHPMDGLDVLIVDPSDGIAVGLGLRDDQFSFKQAFGDASPDRVAASVVSSFVDVAESNLDDYGEAWRVSGDSVDEDEIETCDLDMKDAEQFFRSYFPSMDRLANDPDSHD